MQPKHVVSRNTINQFQFHEQKTTWNLFCSWVTACLVKTIFKKNSKKNSKKITARHDTCRGTCRCAVNLRYDGTCRTASLIHGPELVIPGRIGPASDLTSSYSSVWCHQTSMCSDLNDRDRYQILPSLVCHPSQLSLSSGAANLCCLRNQCTLLQRYTTTDFITDVKRTEFNHKKHYPL